MRAPPAPCTTRVISWFKGPKSMVVWRFLTYLRSRFHKSIKKVWFLVQGRKEKGMDTCTMEKSFSGGTIWAEVNPLSCKLFVFEKRLQILSGLVSHLARKMLALVYQLQLRWTSLHFRQISPCTYHLAFNRLKKLYFCCKHRLPETQQRISQW